MKLRNILLLAFAAVLLACVLVYCFCPGVRLHLALSRYERMLDRGNAENMHLTIYYMDPMVLTMVPLRVEDLVDSHHVKVIEVDSETLAEHWDALRAPDAADLELEKEDKAFYIPPHFSYDDEDKLRFYKGGPRMDARLYYVFETDSGRKLLEFVTRPYGNNIFVNEVEIKHHPDFYKIILPFLTEEDKAALRLNPAALEAGLEAKTKEIRDR